MITQCPIAPAGYARGGNFRMRRFLILYFYISTVLFAENTLLLDVQTRMLPKIMALDSDIKNHSNSSKVTLGVIYDDDRRVFALSVTDKINTYHKGQVGSLKFTAVAIHINELSARRDLSFLYLLEASQTSILEAIAHSKEKKIPAFVYNIADLPLGALGSIAIERSTIIYLNKNTLTLGDYHFNDSLYQMVRWVE